MFGKYVERCLLFADDIVLIGKTEEELVITNNKHLPCIPILG
jgi:hypothetical protein